MEKFYVSLRRMPEKRHSPHGFEIPRCGIMAVRVRNGCAFWGACRLKLAEITAAGGRNRKYVVK